jgi:hypothetical protein
MRSEARLVRFGPARDRKKEAGEPMSISVFVLGELAGPEERAVFLGKLKPVDCLQVEIAHFGSLFPVTTS